MHLEQWFELNLAFGKVEGGGFDKKKWVLEVIGPTRSALGIGGCGAQYPLIRTTMSQGYSDIV